jgi:hypothetical protein
MLRARRHAFAALSCAALLVSACGIGDALVGCECA